MPSERIPFLIVSRAGHVQSGDNDTWGKNEPRALANDIGLSASQLHAKGPIGLEQLTCEKYVAFGSGQLRMPHPVPETYFDAIMLKRP